MPAVGQKRTKWERAAVLIAEDELSLGEVAKTVRVARSTLYEWKDIPEFNALIGDARGKIIAEALKLPIAKKHERVKTLNEIHAKQLEAIRLRAERHAVDADSPAEAARAVLGSPTPPEAATGLFVSQPKISASGKVVTEWAYDAALVKSILDTEKQAATELGQWTEKKELAGEGGAPLTIVIAERVDGPA